MQRRFLEIGCVSHKIIFRGLLGRLEFLAYSAQKFHTEEDVVTTVFRAGMVIKAFDRQTLVQSCPCIESDFECASGFHRDDNSQSLSCIRSPNINGGATGEIPPVCRRGSSSYERTRGYRRISGDKCK